MSKFSGKCDFCDEIEICGLDHIMNCDVFVGESKIPLQIGCIEDCIPYYPYIVTTAGMDNVSKTGTIRLSSRSWVDIEEERYGHMKMHDIFREELRKEMEAHHVEAGREDISL